MQIWDQEEEETIVEWLDGAPRGIQVPIDGGPRKLSSSQPIDAVPIVGAGPGGEWFFVLDRLPAVDDDGPASFRVRRYDPTGRALDEVSIPYDPRPLDEAFEAELEERAEALAAAVPVEAEALLEAYWRPAYLPPVQQAFADDGGYWIHREVTRRGYWERYDLEGQPLHTVRLPPSFRGLATSDSLILGWDLEAEEVPFLREFRIVVP